MAQNINKSFNISYFANPAAFMKLSNWAWPLCGFLTLLFLALGAVFGIFISPEHQEQGDSVRVMYVHVPAAWMSIFTYGMMAVSSIIGFIWKHNLAHMAARLAAPMGLVFTILTIFTGAIWGKVTWGVYWDWDPRMVSMLIMVFIYLGYIALWQAIEDKNLAQNAAAVLCVFGFVMVPIIRYSVNSAGALHQENNSDLPFEMMIPLFLMLAAYQFLFGFYLMLRMRTEIMTQQKQRPAMQQRQVTIERGIG